MLRKLCFVALIIATCSSCSTSTPTPIPPELIISNAINRMTDTSGFRFSIDRTGAAAYLDPLEILSLTRLEGDFIAPDQVQAVVRVTTAGIVTDISFIGIGDRQWQTNPLSGKWESLPTGAAFNPATLFDPEVGLQAILGSDLEDIELKGNAEIETLPGIQLFHLTGRLSGGGTSEITYGLIDPETMNAELWISPDTYELQRIILVEQSDDPEETRTWQFDFWDYDLDLEINPPQS